jgi:hypothetical protein
MQRNNTSGFPGVCWNKERQKWRAAIQTGYRRVLLGEFDDPEEAHKAYKLAEKVLKAGRAADHKPLRS